MYMCGMLLLQATSLIVYATGRCSASAYCAIWGISQLHHSNTHDPLNIEIRCILLRVAMVVLMRSYVVELLLAERLAY